MRRASGRLVDAIIVASLAAALFSILAGGGRIGPLLVRSARRPLAAAGVFLVIRHLVFPERRRVERSLEGLLGLSAPGVEASRRVANRVSLSRLFGPVAMWSGFGAAVGLADAARILATHPYLPAGSSLVLASAAVAIYAATALAASIPICALIAAIERIPVVRRAGARLPLVADLFILVATWTLTDRRAPWSLPAEAPRWLPGTVMIAAIGVGGLLFVVVPSRLRRRPLAAMLGPISVELLAVALGWFLSSPGGYRASAHPAATRAAATSALETAHPSGTTQRPTPGPGARASTASPTRGVSSSSIDAGTMGAPRRAGPNLLLITIDTLRADYVGCYGNTVVKTPGLDALAAGGARFADVTTAIPETAPSHASILTSRYPITHGLRANGARYEDPSPTLAEILKSRGYATAAFVSGYVLKAHLTNLDRGFDVYSDSFSRVEELPGLILMQAFDRLGLVTYVDLWKIWAERRAAATNADAERWIEANASGPFFVWVHYFDPHGPYDPPPPYDRMYYAGDERDPSNTSMRGVKIDYAYQRKPGVTDVNFWIASYEGEITYTDARLSELLERIRALGLESTTLVVVTADHGESLTEHHAWFTHGGNIFQPSVRVPLIVSQPGRVRAGDVETAPARTIDIAPTATELLGLPLSPTFRGRSLAGALAPGEGAESANPHSAPVTSAEAVPDAFIEGQPARRRGSTRFADPVEGKPLGVRSGRFKFVRTPGEGDALYDLGRSAIEAEDVLASEPAIADSLRTRLERWLAEEARTRLERGGALDESEMERLRSLGYLH